VRARLSGFPRSTTIITVVAVLLVGAGMFLLTAAPRSSAPDAAGIAEERARFEAIGALQPTMPATGPGVSVTPTWAVAEASPPAAATPALFSSRVGPEPGTTTNPDRATPSSTPPAAVDMPPALHITIPAVGIDTDIIEVAPKTETIDGQLVASWQVADWVAGHHRGSADPGEVGNIVLAGHDDVRGEVFRGLHDIALGAEVLLTTADGVHRYVVAEIHVRLERDAPLADRLATGQFIAPMPEERLTLITCWPYGIDDHRIIVVAKPPA